MFRGSDVKDLTIVEAPKENKPLPPQVPNDPAILGVSVSPFSYKLTTTMMNHSGCKFLLSCPRAQNHVDTFRCLPSESISTTIYTHFLEYTFCSLTRSSNRPQDLVDPQAYRLPSKISNSTLISNGAVHSRQALLSHHTDTLHHPNNKTRGLHLQEVHTASQTLARRRQVTECSTALLQDGSLRAKAHRAFHKGRQDPSPLRQSDRQDSK